MLENLRRTLWGVKNIRRCLNEAREKDDVIVTTSEELEAAYSAAQEREDIEASYGWAAPATGTGNMRDPTHRGAKKKARRDFENAGYDYRETLRAEGYSFFTGYLKEKSRDAVQ